jgi:hypothetical protein
MTLAEALAQVKLEPGKTYQTRLDDKLIQVRVIDVSELPAAENLSADSPMLDRWFDTPQLAPVRILNEAEFIRSMYPKPIEIADDDLAPGDLT